MTVIQPNNLPPILNNPNATQGPAGVPRNHGSDNPLQNLQLGQVIYGKVLRVYQDNSYLVDINGRQHVVDSAIPLNQNEVFRGRIVGLGERVVLEKMTDGLETQQAGSNSPASQLEQLAEGLQTPNGFDAARFLQQHQTLFNTQTWKMLMNLARQTKQPQSVLQAAVYLQKIGIPIGQAESHPLLREFAAHLSTPRQSMLFPESTAVYLETQPAQDNVTQPIEPHNYQQSYAASETMLHIAKRLQEQGEAQLDLARDVLRPQSPAQESLKRAPDETEAPLDPQDGLAAQTNNALFNQAAMQWLANTQQGGSISHRVIVLPLVLNGKLVELEMALFDQPKQPGDDATLRSRLICVSLNLDNLGTVTASVHALNDHLKIVFAAEQVEGLESLAQYQHLLRNQLKQMGYQLDEINFMTPDTRHATNPLHSAQPALQSVVSMAINQDSVSVLV